MKTQLYYPVIYYQSQMSIICLNQHRYANINEINTSYTNQVIYKYYDEGIDFFFQCQNFFKNSRIDEVTLYDS